MEDSSSFALSLCKRCRTSIVNAVKDVSVIVGTLKGFDQMINLILDDSHERVYSSLTGVEQVVLGLYIVRGDNIAVVGELDEDVDSRLDLTGIKAEPLGSVMILDLGMLPVADEGDTTCLLSTVPALKKCRVERVGRGYFNYIDRRNRNRSLSQCSISDNSSEDEPISSTDEESSADVAYLRSLDPKEWKDQDHYAVLGLKSKRYRATEQEIKKAYRKKVLKHHPDKRKHAGETILDTDHDYFTCITRAYEILGNSLKKRSFDSVDPEFENSIPPDSENSRKNFYKVFSEAFENNARWSKKKAVPSLGDESYSIDDVDTFYSFWYNFESWREYSYLDEEAKEKGECREERKWIERQNKAARLKRKKEEMTRIRELVDNAYACDSRIQKFKDDQKEKKLAQKRAKQEIVRARQEEEQKIKQEAITAKRLEQEKKEEELKAQAAVAKKEKEAIRKALKKERKILRTYCADFKYFAETDDEKVTCLTELDKLCELLNAQRLHALNEELTGKDGDKAKTIFCSTVKELNDQMKQEKQELLLASQKSTSSSSDSNSSTNPWSHDDTQLLIKAVNLFPAGTNSRWEVIANFINLHSSTQCKRSAKEVLSKAKSLQKLDPGMKEEANKQAFNKFEKLQKSGGVSAGDESKPTERFDNHKYTKHHIPEYQPFCPYSCSALGATLIQNKLFSNQVV
ncbi:DnaJ subfamily C member 2 [Nymphon striatum]|nr:DnaJ subfamily C member 2 [Nymphon striatum]